MKIAAAKAIAALARKPVPKSLIRAYGLRKMEFGRDYILPKPFDKRLLSQVSPAIAEAAARSGVARRPIADLTAYAAQLETLIEDNDAYIVKLLDPDGDHCDCK